MRGGVIWRKAMLKDYEPSGAYGRGERLPHHRHLEPAIRALLPREIGRALDVGCGNGYLTSIVAKRAAETLGIDFDTNAIAIASRTHPAATCRSGLAPGPGPRSRHCI